MPSVTYSVKSKGVRLISAEKAWVKGKNGKFRLTPKYAFVGKIHTGMSNMVVSIVKGKRPTYKGDVCELNETAKKQIVNHFYNDNGKRNRKTVAYFGIEKKEKKSK